MQCGFIGLGMLGARMARQVLGAGHALKVFDLDAAAVAKLVGHGATGAASVAQAASEAEKLSHLFLLLGVVDQGGGTTEGWS